MDKKIFNKKRFFFLSITFFFFVIMLFLYLNVSNIMYNNASILLAIKETKNIRTILSTRYNFGKEIITEHQKKDLDLLLSKLEFYPPKMYLKIFSDNGKLVYQNGRDIILESSLSVTESSRTKITYKKTVIKGERQVVYEVIIPVENSSGNTGWFINILFDLQMVDDSFFNEKRLLFLIVFIVNLFIIVFLMVMVLNLQKRLFISENELSNLTVSDKLTGLLTKDAFFNEMRNEIERIESNGGKFSLITADIDNFVDINKKCGHEFGDHILKNISTGFKESFRKFDFIGRFGGDEIIVMMIGASENDAIILSEKCRIFIKETNFFFEGQQIPVTMSFGVASTENIEAIGKISESTKRNNFRNLMFNSLNALSRAKRSGKNNVVKYSDLLNGNQLNI